MLGYLRGFVRSYSNTNIIKQSQMKSLPALLESRRPKQSPELDHSTLSNYKSFKVRHTVLDIFISFEDSTVSGNVVYDLSRTDVTTKEIHLDTSHLKILAVEINDKKVDDIEILPRVQPLGSKLVIPLSLKDNDFQLKLAFCTTKDCTALQWLNANQTSGKPYVFSQLEAIHARSLFPCFDTPSVKSTFTAYISSTLPVVFSGILKNTSKESDSVTKYQFEQVVPIAAYLIGIASGDLVSAPIGPRSTVYAEPFRLKDAQWEFENDVEQFIQAAEKIIFKYEWGTYDILVNVNSYCYGGMESPNMTFTTPTLIAYDKSNIDVIAHELAHSWSGNLVTNCSWNHFWLNEGWTVYLERRIIGAIHGEPTRHFSAIIGWNDLENSINSMQNPEKFSTLIQDLSNTVDPDDAFSSVPYEKGFNLLFYLEGILGGPKEFDPFVKHYFTKFSRQSLDSYQFFDALFEFYSDKRDILENVDWETWLYKPGMPPMPKFDTTLADKIYGLADKWSKDASEFTDEKQFKSAFSPSDLQYTNANQVVLFLDTLVQGHKTKVDWSKYPIASEALISIYDDRIGQSKNAEVIFRLFRFQINAKLKPSYSKLAEWLGTVGRMKFVRPGYRLLNSVDRELALSTFDKFKDTYHPICKNLVKQDLGI